MAYFVPNFLLIIFLQSIMIKSGPTYAKNSKNCQKIVGVAILTAISRHERIKIAPWGWLVVKDQLKNFFFSLNFFLLRVTGKKIQPFENSDFQTRFSRDWDIFGKNGYLRWIRLKKFFKMSKSCFFQKKWPNGLNLRVSRSPNSWCLVRIEFFSKFRQNSMKMMLFC